MNKQQLVTKFLESGLLLTPKTLEDFSDKEDINSIINSVKSTNITLIKPNQTQTKPTLSYKINHQTHKQKLTTKDYTEYYNKKFNVIKNILTSKIDAVSINNLQKEKEACIIGMIVDKINKGYLIEDQTRQVEIISDQQLQKNSVLGFKGVLKEKFFANEVIYPDIPLNKQTKKTPEITLTTKQIETTRLTISPNSKEKKENIISNFDLPAQISINLDQEIKILVDKPELKVTKIQATQTLKQRFLPETNTPNQNNIIEEVPDIFWIIQQEEWKENYKGVLIVSGEHIEL